LVKKIIFLCSRKKIFNKKSKMIFIKDRPGHDHRYALDSKKIKTKLKWSSAIDINEGLSKTIDWYKNNKKFYKLARNVKFFKRLGKNR